MIGETDKVTLRFTHHYWRFAKPSIVRFGPLGPSLTPELLSIENVIKRDLGFIDQLLLIGMEDQLLRLGRFFNTVSFQHVMAYGQIVERPQPVLQGFHGPVEILVPPQPPLVRKQRREEFRNIAQFLGVFSRLVPVLVIDPGEIATVLLELPAHPVECIFGEIDDRLFTIRFGIVTAEQPFVDVEHQRSAAGLRQRFDNPAVSAFARGFQFFAQFAIRDLQQKHIQIASFAKRVGKPAQFV